MKLLAWVRFRRISALYYCRCSCRPCYEGRHCRNHYCMPLGGV